MIGFNLDPTCGDCLTPDMELTSPALYAMVYYVTGRRDTVVCWTGISGTKFGILVIVIYNNYHHQEHILCGGGDKYLN